MCADRSIGNSEGDAFLVDGRPGSWGEVVILILGVEARYLGGLARIARRTWMGSVSFVQLLDGMGRLGVVDDWPCGIRWVFGITEDGSAGMLK